MSYDVLTKVDDQVSAQIGTWPFPCVTVNTPDIPFFNDTVIVETKNIDVEIMTQWSAEHI